MQRLSSWRIPQEMLAAEEPVLYAEALFAPSLAEVLGLNLSTPPEDWLVRMPYDYRKRDLKLMRLGTARALDYPAFIKPPNDKSFVAQVYQPETLPEDFDETMPVLVAEIVQWQCEFRCFLLARELVTFSIYSRFGALQVENDFEASATEIAEMKQFVDTLLADPNIELPLATVLDIGVIEGRGWAAVELNAAWGAGIYGCDPDLVLRVIRRAVSPAN